MRQSGSAVRTREKDMVTCLQEVEIYHIKLGLACIAIMKNALVICVVAVDLKLYKLGPRMGILVYVFTIGLLRAVTVYVMTIGLCRAVTVNILALGLLKAFTVYVMTIGLCRAIRENILTFGLLRALMEYVMTIGLFWHRIHIMTIVNALVLIHGMMAEGVLAEEWD
jgi:hypothetical protein